MTGWRFHAFTITGDGRTRLALPDVQLRSPRVRVDLSGPGEISGTISPELATHQHDGEPVFLPYRTLLAAEHAGKIVQAGIVEPMEVDGPDLTLTAPGITAGLLKNTPHVGTFQGIQVDPLDVVREEIIAHVQEHPGGDLGITCDATTSPVRVGEESRTVEFTTRDGEAVEFEAGPLVLAWWATDDLAKELDDLATETPFDYLMTSAWSGDTELTHHLNLGYPRLGERREGMRFMVGENIIAEMQHRWEGEEYASEVLVLGAGEGRDMIRGTARRATDRMRRVRVVSDKSIRSRKRADALAEATLKAAIGEVDVDEVTVADHPHAPLSAFTVGDEIEVQWPHGWVREGTLWVRILSIEHDPDAGAASLTVTRSETT